MKIRKLVGIPGPTPVTRSIQDQMGRETIAFGDPNFINDFKEVIANLKEIFKQKEKLLLSLVQEPLLWKWV